MNHAVLCGASMVLIPRFDPGIVLEAFQNHDVTIFCGVPTMYWTLLNYPEKHKFDISKIAKTLRLGVSGGASLPVEVIKQFDTEFNVPILEGYGLSETSPVATFTRLDIERKPGSIGVPIPGVEVKLVNENGNTPNIGETGEILIRGVNIMKNYWNKPKETEEAFTNGWFHSGDIGRQDEDGYYYIVDRVKDMIIRGGFNVYPREIEEVLMTHPAVSLVTVIGIPDEEHGEEIKAFIVKKPNIETTENEIINWSKEKMASYKYPRYVEFKEALPMTATGKILKRELRVN
jgi:long-chain acyl-CoA synthetase